MNADISLFQQGCEKTFASVVSFYQQPLIRFAYKITHDEYEAKAIVAEIFVKLWERHTNFEGIDKIKSFLFISTKNASLNYYKRWKKHSQTILALDQDDLTLQLASMPDSMEDLIVEQLVKNDIFQPIYDVIETLPAGAKMVFKCYCFEDMNNYQIAEALNISYRTVVNQKKRAIELLKIRLLDKSPF